ncbi:MAG: hypothetical protein PSV16_05205 [Flavobacterium sp.]|nr:hypothetical protein [Flavobacterium sp.]
MEINWLIVLAVAVGAIVLLFFLIKKNWKDEKEVEKELNYFEKSEASETNDNEDGL